VLLTRLVIGDKPLNKLRGKGIALHSQVRFLTRVLPPTLLHRLLMFMHRRSGPSCIFEAGVHPFSKRAFIHFRSVHVTCLEHLALKYHYVHSI